MIDMDNKNKEELKAIFVCGGVVLFGYLMGLWLIKKMIW